MDTTCKPCTDFWRYVNGGWLDKNPIPADKSVRNFYRPGGRQPRAYVEPFWMPLQRTGAPRPAATSARWATSMPVAWIPQPSMRGDSRLCKPTLTAFRRWKSAGDLGAVLDAFQRVPKPSYAATNGAVVGPLRMLSGQDSKNPSRVIARIVERESAGGSGSAIFSLPDRDYYLRDDEKSRQIRSDFLSHVAKMLELSGTPRADAAGKAKTILDFETELAASVMTIADSQARSGQDLSFDGSGRFARAMAPNFDWAQLFRTMALPDSTPVNVAEPELLKKFNEELTVAPLDTWKTWLRWRTLQLAAPYLPKSHRGGSVSLSKYDTRRNSSGAAPVGNVRQPGGPGSGRDALRKRICE